MKYEEVKRTLEYMISEDCTETQMDFVEEIKVAIKALDIARSYEKINREARRHVEEMRSINNEYAKGYAKGYDQALWNIKQEIFNHKVYGSDENEV